MKQKILILLVIDQIQIEQFSSVVKIKVREVVQ